MSEGSSTAATLAKGGSALLKVLGGALALYVVGIAVYSYFQFSSTKSKLLSYGLSDATGNLVAYAVMLVALAVPAMAVLRFFTGTPRPRDWLAALALPLVSWGTAQLPANFDAVTGEALKYCAPRPAGAMFCLDHPGVDPLTQRPLVKMDAATAERDLRKRGNLAPKLITTAVSHIEFFDSLSDPARPEPKVWVVEDGKGCFKLFDNQGVDPATGEALKPVTKQLVREIKKCAATNAERAAAAGVVPVNVAPAARTVQPPSMPPAQRGLDNASAGAAAQAPTSMPTVVPAISAAELERQRREAMAQAQRRYQADLAELTRARDQESRTAESDYRQAELTARSTRSSALVGLQRRYQQDQTQARTACDLQSKALSKLGALGAITQAGCQQLQNDAGARYQQGQIDVETDYQSALRAAQDGREERAAGIRDRFERSRAAMTQATQSAQR